MPLFVRKCNWFCSQGFFSSVFTPAELLLLNPSLQFEDSLMREKSSTSGDEGVAGGWGEGALAFTEAAEFARTIELRAPEADAQDEEMYAEPSASKTPAVKKEERPPGAAA